LTLLDGFGESDRGWRDSRWVGTTQRWSRGNGWITIALTDTIAALPAADANRAHYLSLLNAMFAKLKATQQSGRYWTADVDHPAAFPAPESSGTSGCGAVSRRPGCAAPARARAARRAR